MKMTSNGLAEGSLPFDPQAATVGIGGTVWAVGIAGAVGIVDGVRGKRRAVAVYLVHLVCLVYLVHLVCLVCFVISFIGSNESDRPNKPDRPKRLERPDRLERHQRNQTDKQGAEGLPALKGLAVESESYGLALRSPRSSAEAERGSGRISRTRTIIHMASLRKAGQQVRRAYSSTGARRKRGRTCSCHRLVLVT